MCQIGDLLARRTLTFGSRTLTSLPSLFEPTSILRQTIATPLGEMVLAATSRGVCLCEFADLLALARELADLERRIGTPILEGDNQRLSPHMSPHMSSHISLLERELAGYFAGTLRSFTVSLDTPGPPFHRAVWERLLRIPYGQTTSYNEIARALDNLNSCRAVGQANGANRLAIVIPCHRVIEKTGKLGGYGGGLHRKRWLLDHESLHAGDSTSPGRASATGSLFAAVGQIL